MHPLWIAPLDRPLRLLCIGAHCDDLEIGCGGTLMTWLDGDRHRLDITWVVLSAHGERGEEARLSAERLLEPATQAHLQFHGFRDGWFPSQQGELKTVFANLGARLSPDLVLTHTLEDRHQDHRLVAELAWQTFRNHLLWEFEIPKYDGDLGRPNLYVPLSQRIAERKVEHLMHAFPSQRSKDWYQPGTFEATLRLRAIECRAESGFAEAFFARKLVCASE